MKISLDLLDSMTDEELLEVRFCDLDLHMKNSEIAPVLDVFWHELDALGIDFRPVVYLSDEWLCPEGTPAIGVPFYLAHHRLKKFEKQMMLEAEGETQDEFLKMMRHEMGHAISYAYKFQSRRKWRELFGQASKEFSDYYAYKKYSRSYVSNIEEGYAQSHPDEDFAETFAVWANPRMDWRVKYQGWRVMEKLEYVDRLIRSVGHKESLVKSHARHFNIRKLKSKLKTHYKRRRKLYAQDYPDFFDRELLAIFTETPSHDGSLRAVRFIQKNRKDIIRIVQRWTGQRQYVIDHLLKRFAARAKDLNLFCANTSGEHETTMMIACLTAYLRNHYYTGTFKGDL